MSDESKHMDSSNGPQLTRIGIVGTKLYVILLLAALPSMAYLGWIKISALELNQVGDFLAGLFGPLAIFWIVLGFFQQGEELRNSVHTLRLQAEELAKSVEQQRELVGVTREQLAHEREMILRQDIDRKRRIQPTFVNTFGPTVIFGSSQARYKLEVSNVGNPASQLEVELTEDGEVVASADSRYLEKGQSIKSAAFHDQPVDIKKRGLDLSIKYTDEDGDKWKLSYQVDCSADGQLEIPTVTLKERSKLEFDP